MDYSAHPYVTPFDLIGLDKSPAKFHLDAMQNQNTMIADVVKVLNGAAGTVAGMSREARDGARERLKETIGGMDFVSREEFDAVKAMAAKSRDENEMLAERIAALEARLGK